MYPSVKEVSPREDFTLLVVFDNGERGILDMKPILEFGVFRRLNDYGKFRQVRVAFDTIEWNCGIDLDPEFIYKKVRETSETKMSNLRKSKAKVRRSGQNPVLG